MWSARRVMALATACLVLASLAGALLPRKPPAPVLTGVLTPVAARAAAAAEADPMDGLRRIAPPAPAPDLRFQDIDGTTRALRDFRGRPVLLNIWATWCGPCVEELPALAALAPRAGKAGIVVLPVSIDRGGAAVVRAFYASHGVDGLPIWNDAEGTASAALGLRGVPTTFLLDAQGREVAKLEGAADWNADGVLEALGRLAR